MSIGKTFALGVIFFTIVLCGYAEEDDNAKPSGEKVRFARYVTRFVLKPKKDAYYIVEGIQHYRDDAILVEDMDITRMWIEDDTTNIAFVESANVTPQGQIDFQNIFVIYKSGTSCIEKQIAKENLDKEKRRNNATCTAGELAKAREFLLVGTEAATREIEKARREEERERQPPARTQPEKVVLAGTVSYSVGRARKHRPINTQK